MIVSFQNFKSLTLITTKNCYFWRFRARYIKLIPHYLLFSSSESFLLFEKSLKVANRNIHDSYFWNPLQFIPTLLTINFEEIFQPPSPIIWYSRVLDGTLECSRTAQPKPTYRIKWSSFYRFIAILPIPCCKKSAAVGIEINIYWIAWRKSPLQSRSSVATTVFLPVVGSPVSSECMCKSKEHRTIEKCRPSISMEKTVN